MKQVKLLHFDLVLIPEPQDQKRFEGFNWQNFKAGDKIYLDDNMIGYYETQTEDSILIAVQ